MLLSAVSGQYTTMVYRPFLVRDTIQVMSRNKKGFSLVELLVVVGFVGFLATGIFFGDIFSFRKRANEVKDQSVFQLAELALEQYANLCGQYPPQMGGSDTFPLEANEGCPSGTTLADLISVGEAEDMSSLLYVPYASLSPTNCVGYHLATVLDADNSLLEEDHDVDSAVQPEGVTHCVTDASVLDGINGADPVYDIMKPAALRRLF